MKKLLALLVVVALGIWLLPSLLSGANPFDPAPAPPTGSTELPPLAAPAGAVPMTVDYVHDGDTLFVLDAAGERLKVRLTGIDTPEIASRSGGDECFGPEATARLRALLPEGATVLAAADAEPLDRYGRSLLYVWSGDGTFINRSLVADGYATALSIRPNVAYEAAFAEAEGEASGAGRGLWGAC